MMSRKEGLQNVTKSKSLQFYDQSFQKRLDDAFKKFQVSLGTPSGNSAQTESTQKWLYFSENCFFSLKNIKSTVNLNIFLAGKITFTREKITLKLCEKASLPY